MTLNELLAAAILKDTLQQPVEDFCRQHGVTTMQALNELARHVAQQLVAGDLMFTDGAGVMKSIFTHMTRADVLAQAEGQLPEPAASICLAFDAGEFQHAGDGQQDDPVAKHTIPLLQEVMAQHAVSPTNSDSGQPIVTNA